METDKNAAVRNKKIDKLDLKAVEQVLDEIVTFQEIGVLDMGEEIFFKIIKLKSALSI